MISIQISLLWMAAALGAICAVFADMVQKGPAAAPVRLAQTAVEALNLSLPPVIWALALVALGVGIYFIKQPTTRNGAFCAGASIVAILMTTVPFQEGPPPQSRRDLPADDRHASMEPGVRPAPNNSNARAIVRATGATPITFIINLRSPGAPTTTSPSTPARVTIYEINPDGSYAKSATFRMRVPSRTEVSIDGSGRPTRYVVRVEAAGYQIASQTQLANPGVAQLNVDMTLEPSSTPLSIQRFFRRPVE